MRLSAAWSRKLSPMHTILLGRPIGGPSRTEGGTRGGDFACARNRPCSEQNPPFEKVFVVVHPKRGHIHSRIAVQKNAGLFLSGMTKTN